MNVADFIEKHVKQELIKLGYSAAVAQGGVNAAIDFYRKHESVKKGSIFSECLREAKIHAEYNCVPAEKPKKTREKNVKNYALF